MQRVHFDTGIKEVTGTKPQRLQLGDWYCEPSTWARAMEMAAKALLCDVRYRDRLLKSIRSIKGFGAVSAEMRLPRKIDANLYLECNRSANGCLRTIRLLLEAAGFPQNEAAIEYEAPQNGSNDAVGTPPSSVAETVTPTPPLSSLAETVPPKPVKDARERPEKEPYTAYPKRELFAALAEDRIPDDDFDKLLTLVGTRTLLGMTPRHDTPVFSLSLRQFFWRDAATRRGRPVFVTAQWFQRDKSKLDRMLSRWATKDGEHPRGGHRVPSKENTHEVSKGSKQNCPASPLPEHDMKRFLEDIQEHWPEGFDFSDGALRLLEGRCGSLSRGMIGKLKSVLFRARNGVWLAAESVAPKTAMAAILSKADHLVAEAGFASVSLIGESLASVPTRLSSEKERVAFAKWVLESEGRIITVFDGIPIVVRDGFVPSKELPLWCGHIRETVSQSGTAGVESLMDNPAFSNVTRDELVALMRVFEPEAIPEMDANGDISFKMLAEFYLPDDFGETIRDIANKADADRAPLTAASLCSALSERYSCDFAQDYALDPGYSLKWAVDAVWRKVNGAAPREWEGSGARARYITPSGGNASMASPQNMREWNQPSKEAEGGTLLSQIESAFSGVFTNADFWHYSIETYGLAGTREAKIAQLGHLAPRFIRLDRDHWMSVADFREASSWGDAKIATMEHALNEALGSAPMLPMAGLGAATLDSLPEIPYRWTPELAASVAAHLCPGVNVANHGVTPFAVTALLVPRPIAPEEVLDYTLGIYCARNPYTQSVDDAFEFLKENNICFRLTKNCRREIEAFLEREAH